MIARARATATLLDRRLATGYPAVQARIPALADVAVEVWLPHATVAAAALTMFPLLRFVQGDVARYQRAIELLRAGLRQRHPNADALWDEADRSTVPPTGRERTRTLAEVDESQALALARWVLVGCCGAERLGRSWESVRDLAVVLRGVVEGHWQGE